MAMLGYGNPSDYLAKQQRKELLASAKAQAKDYEKQLKLNAKLNLILRKAEDKAKDKELKAEQKYDQSQLKKSYGYVLNQKKEQLLKKTYTDIAEVQARKELGLRPKDYDRFGKSGRFAKGFRSSLKSIASSIPVQRVPIVNPRPQLPQRPERPNKLRNFFAHKSEEEVYGDTGLTFFDGDKRGDDDTGALFGL